MHRLDPRPDPDLGGLGGVSLRPIIEGLPCAAWAGADPGGPFTHFGERAIERGIRSIPGDALKRIIEHFARAGRDDMVEHVFDLRGANWARLIVMRFIAPEGVFFAVLSEDLTAVTVYDRALMREVRKKRRWQRRRGRPNLTPPT